MENLKFRTAFSYACLVTLVSFLSVEKSCVGQEASPFVGQQSNIIEDAPERAVYPYQDLTQEDQLDVASTDLKPATSRNRRKKLKLRRRNRYRNRNKNKNKNRYEDQRHQQQGYDEYNNNEDDYNDDRDDTDSYNAPKAPVSSYNAPAPAAEYSAPSSGYNAPSSGYEAPASSYKAPSSSYGAPSYSPPSYGGGGGGGGGFNDFLNALAAFLPIGLFLAAIPPNLITISTGKRRRKRDEIENMIETETGIDSDRPFMNRIDEIGFENLQKNPECQKLLFCEMATYGAQQPDANWIQKTFNYLSIGLSMASSDHFDDDNYFSRVRNGNCKQFKCST